MKLCTHPSQFRKNRNPIFLGAGFFDGVHKGHQIVLSTTLKRARETGGEAWVLTFDRHPLSVLAPSKSPALLTTLDDRLRLFETMGIDGVLVLPFTRQLAVQEPESFVKSLCGTPHLAVSGGKPCLATGIPVCEIRCGDNWRFGRRAAGTPHVLAQLGEIYGFRVEIVPYAFYQGVEISSTRIRTAVCEGRLADAAAMLGRPFFIRGQVCRGRGVGHSVLKTATANILPHETGVMPPFGVYAVRATCEAGTFCGVADWGCHPTFDSETARPVLETHLLDYAGDLYDRPLTVSFLSRLREERTFPTPEALARQIQADIAAARACYTPPPESP
ncbi:MAG: riboflavin biosynthesis protein RibF [Kiritimatiellae bacterium]|nr:riboflavin biosynthesis protein RibF [Kiritimatiellia bacterium]